MDGRVKRRLRRNGLSEEVNTIEWDKKREAKRRRSQVERLRRELEAKDEEMEAMRDEQDLASQLGAESGTTVASSFNSMSTKVQELEEQIEELKRELEQKDSQEENPEENPDWTMATKDPFEADDNDNMMTNYDDDFGMSMMNDEDELMTTPTRLNTSFPSPPVTGPNTPCKPPSVGVQTSPGPDPENEALKEQLSTLQSEIHTLTSTLALTSDNNTRLSEKLTSFLPPPLNTPSSHDYSTLDSALDSVLTQLALSQSLAVERQTSFSALSNEIQSLGFSSASSPEETLALISSQFRNARLELEYLTPGEVSEGFENEKLLSMLLSRIKFLLEKVQQRDQQIDEYHDQELLLRQQLNTRVDALQNVQNELHLVVGVVSELKTEAHEKDVSNERLRDALEGYRSEVSNLESLIEQMETDSLHKEGEIRREAKDLEDQLQHELLAHDTTRAEAEGRAFLVQELERRLNSALEASTELKNSLMERDHTISSLNQEHENEISSRNSQILALQQEMEKLSQALEDTRSMMEELRDENSVLQDENSELKDENSGLKDENSELEDENRELEAQVVGEKRRGKIVVQAMRGQLERVLEMGRGFLEGDVDVQGPVTGDRMRTDEHEDGEREREQVVRKGGLFDKEAARRRSGGIDEHAGGKKRRRRYDSGLGFLAEDDEGLLGSGDLASSDY